MLEKTRMKVARWLARGVVKSYRMIKAARSDRFTSDWNAVSLSADAEMRNAIRKVRDRARDLEYNNDYAKKYIEMFLDNVIGPNGIMLNANIRKKNGSYDEKASKHIENLFADWCKDCATIGKMNFVDYCRLAALYKVRDGETITRIIENFPHNKYKFALEMIDPELLDETYIKVEGENRIRLGVEYDKWNRPVAYHFIQPKGNNDIYGAFAVTGERRRVPAEEIIHTYDRQRIAQSRGISSLVQSMLRLHNLEGLDDAAITNARIGASKMAFIEQDPNVTYEYDGEVDEHNNPVMDIEPATIGYLGRGQKLSMWDPQFPDAEYAPFVKAFLRGIASGLGVSYNSLANDLEGVNYSSLRDNALKERDKWTTQQNIMINNFITHIYNKLVEWFYYEGYLDGFNYSVDQWKSALWQGKRWNWVDPQKDVNANVIAINNGLKTRGEVRAEMNQNSDINNVFEDLSLEYKDMESKGIKEYIVPKQGVNK